MHDAELSCSVHALRVAKESKKPTTKFGRNLQRLMKAAGTNKNRLAEKWNRLHPDDPIKVYNLTRWSRAPKGRVVAPSLYEAEKVAEALNVPIDALLGGASASALNAFQVRVIKALRDDRFLAVVTEALPPEGEE